MADYNDFVSAIDNHNVANGDASWLSKRIDATGNLIGDIGEGIFKGAPSAVVAGVDSILNSGIAVGNFLGADITPISTYDVLKGLDSDLGAYYQKHTEGVEIAGFAMGMFAPGTAGVWAMKAAKAGFIGKNMANSAGLMATFTTDYAKIAKAEFAASNNPFAVLNKSTLQALAQGLGSSALDMGAFNTAVTLTMFKSPLLDKESIPDLFWNDVKDTLIFGGIGGVFRGFQIYGEITRAGQGVDYLTYPYRAIEKAPKNATPVQQIIQYFNDKFNLPVAEGPLNYSTKMQEATGLSADEALTLVTKERGVTVNRLDELIRQNFNEFAKGDTAIGNQLFEIANKAQNIEEVYAGILNAKSVGRISVNESVMYGDVKYFDRSLTSDQFQNLIKAGDYDLLLTGKGTENSSGYHITGNLADIRMTQASKDLGKMWNRDTAFNEGYDIYRNSNGSLSVNPESKIIKATDARPVPNIQIMDLENGTMVTKAFPNLADLSTPTRKVEVRGNTVLAGNLEPIKVGNTKTFDVRGNKIKIPEITSYLDAQANYIWAQGAKINWDGLVIGENNLPVLERLYADDAKLKHETAIFVEGEAGRSPAPRGEALRRYIEVKKESLAKEMNGMPVEEIALRLNTTEDWLTKGSGESTKIKPGYDYTMPRYAKIEVTGDNSMYPMMNTLNHQGAIEYAHQIKIIKERNEATFTNFALELATKFPDAPNWLDPARTPTRKGAGATLFGFANANFGSAGAWAQTVAQQVDKLLLKRKTDTANTLNYAIADIRSSGKEAVAEAALINNKLLQSDSTNPWKFAPDGSNSLVKRIEFDAIKKDPAYEPEDIIDIKNESVANYLRTRQKLISDRQIHINNMKGDAGIGDNYDYNALYGTPIDTEKLKHFVMIKPLAPVSIDDKMRVVAAKDQATLERLIKEVDTNQYEIVTKTEGENWHKSVGDYKYSLGLNESRVDSALTREGKLSQHFPTIDEGFLESEMQWHMRQEEILTHSAVYHKYAQQFEELKSLGERYTNIATSQFRSITEKLEQSVKDPYQDIIKTALNISRSSEYQYWTNFNTFIKDAIEKPINKIRDVFSKADKIDDNFVSVVTQYAKEMGQGQPFVTTANELIANGNIPNKPWVQRYVAKLNSVLSTTLLQWDTFNAVNNTVSTAILAAPEMQKLIRGIMEGNAETAGKLKDLIQVTMPDGSGIVLPTTGRLLMNAHNNFFINNEVTKALTKRYEDIGAINTLGQEMRQALDNATLNFAIAGEDDATSALNKVVEFGRKWTGNNKAEQYTRFVSADMARQIGDLGVQTGLITEKESNELISIFTNRTQGNYLYSQRPIVFQGVVGQAVGLFQTYQFNLMQQLFKHVAEGDNKSLAMLAGLQSSIYGMQGLPAFNFLNTHIVGNASGNTEHKDLYTASYTTFGKSLGDWIMYGAGSNALGLVDPSLRVNLYSRGDINPRQLTVLPTQISDIPLVAASTKFIGNILGALDKVGKGSDIIPTISQAIEHNGLSRPLSGLAQIAQGYTTNNAGGLLSSSQDFMSIATLARAAGAKPFDESLALDALYRINAYRSSDQLKIAELGSAIKTTVVAGKNPSTEQINEFAAEYAKQGGRLEGFNKYFSNLVMQANRSQVNAISENLRNPMAKNLQVVLGGESIQDFAHTPVTK